MRNNHGKEEHDYTASIWVSPRELAAGFAILAALLVLVVGRLRNER